jgi:hypothetical protein
MLAARVVDASSFTDGLSSVPSAADVATRMAGGSPCIAINVLAVGCSSMDRVVASGGV